MDFYLKLKGPFPTSMHSVPKKFSLILTPIIENCSVIQTHFLSFSRFF